MFHESPHNICEEINNQDYNKISSPFVKGVSQSKGENGDLFEFLIMVI